MLDVITGPAGTLSGTNYYVDMSEWGYSNAEALATHGAGPCLNVVVHQTNRGCLAHIWNSSLDQAAIYRSACEAIGAMIGAIGQKENLEIWLGAGHAFSSVSHYGKLMIMAPHDFQVVLTRYLQGLGCRNFTILDDRTPGPSITDWDPGNVLYDPPNGRIYILQERDGPPDEVYKIQTGRKARTSGKIEPAS